MFPAQTLLIPLDADALAQLIRTVVRSELAIYVPPVPAPQLPEYLTRGETAKLYRISLVTLNEWDKNDLIPKKVKINGRVRYHRDEILASLNAIKHLKHKKKF